jgi:hypothetical protein
MEEHIEQPVTKPKWKKLVVLIVTTLLLVAMGSAASFLLPRNDSGPLPKEIRESATFPLYYPTEVPTGYVLNQDSMKLVDSKLFYELNKQSSTIYVTQQSAPSTPPDFKKLTDSLSFKKIDTDNGEAVTGLNGDSVTAILLTNTTLITANASDKSIPSDTVSSLIKAMRSL